MTISFEVPTKFLASHTLGAVVRYGAILKDAGTGRIVGHLQETSALHALSQAGSVSLNPLAAIVDTASGIASNYQLYRVDQKITAVQNLLTGVATMQAATLATCGLGIGISVIGFMALKRRLDQTSAKLDEIKKAIQSGFDKQAEKRLQDQEAELAGQLDLAEEGWHAKDGGKQNWTSATEKLGAIENFYAREIESSIRDGVALDALTYLLDRYRVAIATKIECLVLRDEFKNAAHYTQTVSRRAIEMFDSLTPVSISESFGRVLAIPAKRSHLEDARALIIGIRELQDQLLTNPFVIARIAETAAHGRDYIEKLKDEQVEPLLVLPNALK